MTFPLFARVRVTSLSHTLRDDGAPSPLLGTVVGNGTDGYILVALDRPIAYWNRLPGSPWEPLSEIWSLPDNLVPAG